MVKKGVLFHAVAIALVAESAVTCFGLGACHRKDFLGALHDSLAGVAGVEAFRCLAGADKHSVAVADSGYGD